MSGITHFNSINVQGAVESSTQGKLLGTFKDPSAIPAASAQSEGQTFLFIGTSGSGYENGKYYTCVKSGSTYSWSSTTISNPSSITVDSSLSSTSTNPVQNKAVQEGLNQKVDKDGNKVLSTNDYTTAEKNKLAGINMDSKEDKLTGAKLNAVNSGITADLVSKYNGYEATINGKLSSTDASTTYATKAALNDAVTAKVSIAGPYASTGAISSPQPNVIYLVNNGGSGGNVYDEYLYTNNTWEKIGTTATDLSNYYTKTESGNTFVPKTTTVNGKALSGNISLTASDVGALASNGKAASATKADSATTADSATKATQDGSGNVITSTYVAKTAIESTSMTDDANKIPSSKAVLSAINNIQTVQFTLKVKYTGASDLSGISVTATPTSGAAGVVPVQGTTDGSGVAYLTVRQGVAYTITSSKTNYVFETSPAVTCTDLTTEVSISCYVPGSVTIVVKDGRSSGATVTVTASCTGQTTQTKTVTLSSTSNNVTFTGLAAGTWTFTSTYPSTAAGADTVTVAVASNQSYTEELNILYVILYVVQIDESVSSPTARVTYPTSFPDGFVPSGKGYTNEAAGFTPASGPNGLGSWATSPLITGIKRQTVDSSIKSPSESDFTDVEDKRSAVAGSSSLDVFTYFPTWYVKMVKNGTIVTFGFANQQLDASWRDYAGSVGSNHIGHFRLGCFCSPVSSAVKSYGGTKSQTISLTNAIKYTQTDRGTGFDIMTWYQWTYIAMLMTAMFKTTDLQSTLGNGVSSGSQSTQAALSFSNDFGMYGTTSNKTSQMSFFWLQNIYGDYYQWCGGAHTNSSYNLQTNTGYSSTTSWDKTTATGVKDIISGYITKVVGTTDAGFFPVNTDGTGSTHYADYGYVASSTFPRVGGDYNGDTYCGPFYATFGSYTSGTNAVRLSYRL